ncbi:MAG: YjbF family lipoprotein [Planktomarina sp.]
MGHIQRTILLAVLCIGLTACSNADEEDKNMGALLFEAASSKLRPSEPAPQTAPLVFTRAQFAAVPGSVVLVTLESNGEQGAVVQAAQNGDVITYHSADGIALSLRQGILMGTRGFGFDLMEADVGGIVRALMQNGPRSYEKRLSYLDGEDRLRPTDQTCTLVHKGPERITVLGQTYRTQTYDETCTHTGFETVNRYWMSQGRLIKSRQWVGENVSPLVLELLK